MQGGNLTIVGSSCQTSLSLIKAVLFLHRANFICKVHVNVIKLETLAQLQIILWLKARDGGKEAVFAFHHAGRTWKISFNIILRN